MIKIKMYNHDNDDDDDSGNDNTAIISIEDVPRTDTVSLTNIARTIEKLRILEDSRLATRADSKIYNSLGELSLRSCGISYKYHTSLNGFRL